MTEYRTMTEFYAARPNRQGSPEADFGVDWESGGDQWPRWRVSYLHATGEIIAVRTGGASYTMVLAVIRPDVQLPGPGMASSWYRTVAAMLDGWSDPDVAGWDLAWVTGRLAAGGALAPR